VASLRRKDVRSTGITFLIFEALQRPLYQKPKRGRSIVFKAVSFAIAIARVTLPKGRTALRPTGLTALQWTRRGRAITRSLGIRATKCERRGAPLGSLRRSSFMNTN
jgi:hypothetical protein